MTGREETNRKMLSEITLKIQNDPVLRGYLSDMRAAGLEPTTCCTYINHVIFMRKRIQKPLDEINMMDINDFFQSLKRGDKPQTYLRTYWYSLNRFFGYLVRAKIVSENIMELVSKPKAKPSREVKRIYLTPKECKLLLEDAEEAETPWTAARDKAILRLFIETGIRCTALTDINIEDFDFDKQTLRITDKENKTTVFPLSLDLAGDILMWTVYRKYSKNISPEERALFICDKLNTRLTQRGVSKIVALHSENALGKVISPHKLRASFATNLYNATGDIYLVQQAMNHAKITTTELYIQSDDRNRKKASAIMNSLLKGED